MAQLLSIDNGKTFCAAPLMLFFNLEKAPQIFVSDRKNRLNVAMAMPHTIFTSIHQKFDTRRMDEFYG